MSNRPYAERKQDYYNILQAAQKVGIPHPEIVAAQWALEADWGDKVTGKHNYWGVKAGNGDPNNKEKGTVSWTKENIGGKEVSMQQKFRDYETLEEALKDRAAFTAKKGGRYDKTGYFTATSPAEAAMALQKAGYATDKEYAKSLIDVMKGVGLDPYNGQRYDYSPTKSIDMAANKDTRGTPTPNLASFFAPPKANEYKADNNGFENFYNQPEDPLRQIEQAQPMQSNAKKFQQQLAQAFGIAPEVGDGIPSHINDLIKSIWDQTA